LHKENTALIGNNKGATTYFYGSRPLDLRINWELDLWSTLLLFGNDTARRDQPTEDRFVLARLGTGPCGIADNFWGQHRNL